MTDGSTSPLTPAAAADLFRAAPDRHLDVGAGGQAAHRRVGHGPDVLFVHDWPVSGATFRTLLPFLVEHVTCHVIDFPGTGSSRFTLADTLSVDQHIETARRVVDLLEFDEFFLAPIHEDGERREAAVRLLRSFERRHVRDLADLHRRIDVPVQLVWGQDDPFFPVAWARGMVDTFPDARLEVIEGTRLFCHEERPAEVAAALLPVLTG